MKNSNSNRMKPYCSRTGRHCHAMRGGMKANSTFEPSSGGIGIRLKIIRTRLIDTKIGRAPPMNPWLSTSKMTLGTESQSVGFSIR